MATNENRITPQHRQTYQLFVRLVAYSTVAAAVILIGMAVFLV